MFYFVYFKVPFLHNPNTVPVPCHHVRYIYPILIEEISQSQLKCSSQQDNVQNNDIVVRMNYIPHQCGCKFCNIFDRYERLLKRARTEDLTEISALRCLYRTGQDRFGRPVIVFVGKNFPANTVDMEKVEFKNLLYFHFQMNKSVYDRLENHKVINCFVCHTCSTGKVHNNYALLNF